MEITNKNLCSNELRKIALLMTKASDLGMDISGYGVADVNQYSGNTYLWLEDYPFTLFITLGDDSIWANWSSPMNGEEHEIEVYEATNLDRLEKWANDLYELDYAQEEARQ